MYDVRIPEISSSAGDLSDGVLRGKVNQSLLVTSLSNVTLASTVYAIRRDSTTSGPTFVDVSTVAGDDTTNDFEPFGPTSAFSSGDSLYVACDHDVHEIYVKIGTPGVWTGTGIEIYASSDGLTANTLLTNLVDGSNGFRNAAGVYRITFDHPVNTYKAFSPVPGDITSRKWLVIKPKNMTAVTTAPKLDRIWLVHHSENQSWMDLTSYQNASMTDNVFGAMDTNVFPTVGAMHYYAFPFLAYGMDLAVFRKYSIVLTRTVYYLASDETWKTLPDWNDPSSGLTNGPATLGTTATAYARRWTIPTDWAEKTLSFPMNDSTTKSITGYFLRMPITSIATYGPMQRALWRARGKAFGTANSSGYYKFETATTINRINIGHIGVSSTTDMTVQLVNINTGRGSSFTVPANTTAPYITDLANPLSFAVNEQMAIMYVSGTGTMKDVEMHLA